MGQFERTLIIVDEGAYVHYVEGCTAPIYSSDSLHCAVVEIIVKKNARCRYTTIQNWSNNVYNLVTKRAVCARGRDHGVDRRQHRLQGDDEVPGGLHDRRARQGRGALGRDGRRGPAPGRRRQDGARRAAHLLDDHLASRSPAAAAAPRTAAWSRCWRARTTAGRTVKCDALLVDTISRSDTYPYVDIREDDVSMGHEATVSKISDDQLFYLMSRGLTEDEAMAMIVRGFIEPIAKELPDGVRAGAQPADRAADGGRGRLSARAVPPSEQSRLTGRADTDGDRPRRSTKSQALRSFDVADFPALTGREEEWRFTPLKRLRGLATATAPADRCAAHASSTATCRPA